MTTTAYEFSSVTDPQNVWTNEANTIDGNDATFATTATAESGSNNQLHFSSPATGSGLIGAVRLRLLYSSGSVSTHVVVKSGSTTLYDATNAPAGGLSVYNLPAPTSAGWQWSDVSAITVTVGEAVPSGAAQLATVQLSVQTFAYRWPIMVGIDASLAAASARANPIGSSVDSPWGATTKFGETCAPCDLAFQRLFVDLNGTTPGGTGPEVFAIRNNAPSQLGTNEIDATMTNAISTVNDDGTATVNLAPGETARIDRTLTAAISNAAAVQRLMTYVCADTFPLFARTAATVGVNATVFIAAQDSTSTNAGTNVRKNVIPVAGTVSNLYVKKLEPALASGSYTVTLIKNGSATALTATVDNTGALFHDTTHSVSVAAGDTLCWQITGSSASTASSFAVSACFDSTVPGLGLLLGGNATTIGASATYNNWYGAGPYDTTEANVQAYGGHCQITALNVLLSASPGGAPGSGKSRTITLRKGGSSTALAVTMTDTATTGSAAVNVLVEEGDLLSMQWTQAGTANAGSGLYGLAYSAQGVTETFPEAEGLTDSTSTTSAAYVRNPATEAGGLTDHMTYDTGSAPVAWTRSISDPEGATDIAYGNPRKVADVLGLTDDGTAVPNSSEIGALTDALTIVRSINVTLGDALGATDHMTANAVSPPPPVSYFRFTPPVTLEVPNIGYDTPDPVGRRLMSFFPNRPRGRAVWHLADDTISWDQPIPTVFPDQAARGDLFTDPLVSNLTAVTVKVVYYGGMTFTVDNTEEALLAAFLTANGYDPDDWLVPV